MSRKQKIKDYRWRSGDWVNNRIDVSKAKFQNQGLKDFGFTGFKGQEKQKGFEYNWSYHNRHKK